PSHRRDPAEPQGRRPRRDAPGDRHVPGHGQDGARRRLHRDRRLVRDAGARREVARRTVPEGTGHAGMTTMLERRRNQIPRAEILDLGDYERQRDGIRARAISARAIRRVELGPNATISFENRETVKYQIQEMLRAERIAKEPEVAHEIETYSDLLPASDELSATLMFEFPEAEGRDVKLRDLVGFDSH